MNAAQTAARLEQALVRREPIEPLAESGEVSSLEEAYSVQQAWHALRERGGDRVVGHKIGLTSRAMQELLGVDQPDFGCMWESRWRSPLNGTAQFEAGLFLAPRAEGEIAFRLGAPLKGPGVSVADVRLATEALAPCVEVIDSRIRDWRIGLLDTVADNASFGAFTLGAWSAELAATDLAALPMRMLLDGREVSRATGAAVLGDPAAAVAWLANQLATFGGELAAGDVVMAGALAAAVPLSAGSLYTVELADEPPLSVALGGDAA